MGEVADPRSAFTDANEWRVDLTGAIIVGSQNSLKNSQYFKKGPGWGLFNLSKRFFDLWIPHGSFMGMFWMRYLGTCT